MRLRFLSALFTLTFSFLLFPATRSFAQCIKDAGPPVVSFAVYGKEFERSPPFPEGKMTIEVKNLFYEVLVHEGGPKIWNVTLISVETGSAIDTGTMSLCPSVCPRSVYYIRWKKKETVMEHQGEPNTSVPNVFKICHAKDHELEILRRELLQKGK